MTLRNCRTCGTLFRPVGKARYCSAECRCGTDAGYNAGCKCPRCLKAHARRRKADRCIPTHRVPSLGTRRRVQALACLGWSTAELSRRLGFTRSYLQKTLTRDELEAATHAAVATLYEELCMTWCTSSTAARTAADARARGYAPPLAWNDGDIDNPTASPAGTRSHRRGHDDVDQVVVDRILAGEYHLPATKAERAAVVTAWTTSGRPLADLERLTGWNANRYRDTTTPRRAA